MASHPEAVMNATPDRSKALPRLVKMLVMQPLLAVPFALFFGTIMGGTWPRYVGAYRAALVFAVVITVFIWATEWFLLPLLRGRDEEGRKGLPVWAEATIYAVMAMAGSAVAAVIIHFTLLPGFMGGGRQLITIGMFSLLFSVLFTGLAYAFHFYRQSLDKARADQELNMARRIQRSFLLSQFPEMPRLEVHAINVSSKQVSGDFYDVVPAGDSAFLLAIADVAGKGVPAALLSSMLQASLRTQAMTVPSSASILQNINGLVYRSTSVAQFATFFLARVDEETLTLSFTNAGHNYPIVFRRDGSRSTLERGGTVVGILEQVTFEEETIQLEPGDRVVFYTDGINEAARADGELFGEERIVECVTALPREHGARETVEHVLETVRLFLDGVEPGDDMTVMVLRVIA
jgi:serine phosphatase RsbU (regulator of sigma subunit)